VFLASAVVCGAAGAVINVAAGNPSKLSKRAVWEIGGSVLALWAVAAVLLLFAISRFNRAREATKHEYETAKARQLAAEHLAGARRLAGQLLAGEAPTVEQVWDVVLQAGERVLLDGSVGYSRYYGLGSAATYTHVSTRHYGDVGVGRALLDHAVDRAGNRSRAEGAAFAAAARWRDQQHSRVVVSDRRLHCQVQTKGWLSFDHAAVKAIEAAPEKHEVVLEYPDAAPVCLSGPLISQILVVVVWALYGADGLRQHPALAQLRLETEAPTAAAPAVTDLGAGQRSAGDGRATGAPRLDLLAFVAAHELVLAEHAAVLLGVSEPDAAEQLQELVEQGLVSRVRLSIHSPTAYRITQQGADRVGSGLPPLRPMDLTGYRRAVAVPGLWLAARAGSFGETPAVLTARQMQAADATSRTGSLLDLAGAKFGNQSPQGETDAGSGYPDLGLLTAAGGWVTADLLFAIPEPLSLHSTIGRAHRDSLIVEQWCFVENLHSRKLIEDTAAELGLSDRVRVQLIESLWRNGSLRCHTAWKCCVKLSKIPPMLSLVRYRTGIASDSTPERRRRTSA
jgi:hypothetical protein